ncbi:MAG: N-6 DNA methylase [candidate division WOR-3 bacterium]
MVNNDEVVKDYITGRIVTTAKKEHKEAVNVFAKKLVEELGYSKEQIQTIPQFRVKSSPSGKPTYPVDIAVFRDSQKDYNNVYMLVECKQPTKEEGREQLNIYLNLVPSVELGVWFNGKEHLYLWKVQDPETKRWIWKEIPQLPKKGERVEDIGLYKRKDLEKPRNLKQIFNDIRNHLAGMTTGITRDEAIAQEIINLLFCKIYDEINTPSEEQVRFRAGVNESPEKVKERIISLFNEVLKEYDDVFDAEDKIKLDADSLVYVVGELQRYALTEADRDAIGDAFEVFIGPALRGTEGQFFTPRNVVKMAIEILDPKIGEYIIDPACGSGGFLIVALEYIWKKLEEEAKKKNWSQETLISKKKEVASKFIAGIDKDSFLAKVTKAYMAIVGDGRGGIFCENSLFSPNEWNSKTKEKINLKKFDVVITNPPFGAKIPVKGENILSQYELGFVWEFDEKTNDWQKTNKLRDKQPPQILFIERCLQLLKPGGRMGIILPEGILGNIKDEYIRKFILKEADILAVIDLPSTTFQPSTATKTCFLFLRKKDGEEKDGKIFMAIANKVGHDRRGKPIPDDDLPLIAESYKGKGTYQNAFWISKNDITDFCNLIPRRYNPDLFAPLKEIKNKNIPTKTLRELLKGKIISIEKGDEVGSENYTTEGIPFIRTNDIVNGIINRNSKQMIDKELYEKIYKRKQDLKPKDILFTKDGKIGVVGMIKEGDECVIASGILKIRVIDEKKLNPFYLFAALNSKIVFLQAQARYVIAATLAHLHIERFLDIEIPFLDIDKQNEIGEIIKNIFDLKSKADNELYEFKENFVNYFLNLQKNNI